MKPNKPTSYTLTIDADTLKVLVATFGWTSHRERGSKLGITKEVNKACSSWYSEACARLRADGHDIYSNEEE